MKIDRAVIAATLTSIVIALISAGPAIGQNNDAKSKPPRNVAPEFQPPEVDPDLPNVLLLGDSISIGYTLAVRQELAGEANLWRAPVNCGPTTRGLESLDDWLADQKWDVIHFNFGLHDLKFMGKNNENLADPKAEGSHRQVPIEAYQKNLRQIAERLTRTGATVIWCQTTPVPKGSRGRIAGDAKRYNEAAEEALAEVEGIEVNPLYAYAIKHANLQRPANVHYTPEGSEKLAEQVADVIRTALSD